jgi:hypothetical protein
MIEFNRKEADEFAQLPRVVFGIVDQTEMLIKFQTILLGALQEIDRLTIDDVRMNNGR